MSAASTVNSKPTVKSGVVVKVEPSTTSAPCDPSPYAPALPTLATI